MTKLSKILPYVQYSQLLKDDFDLFFTLVKDKDITFDQLLFCRDVYSFLHLMTKEQFEHFFVYLHNEQHLTEKSLYAFLKNFLATSSPRNLFIHLPTLHSFLMLHNNEYEQMIQKYVRDLFETQRKNLHLTYLLTDSRFFMHILTHTTCTPRYIIDCYKDAELLQDLYLNKFFLQHLIETNDEQNIQHLLKLTRKTEEKKMLKHQYDFVKFCIQKNYFNNAFVKRKICSVVIDDSVCSTIRAYGFLEEDTGTIALHNLFVLQEYFEKIVPDQQKLKDLLSSEEVYAYCTRSNLFHEIFISHCPLTYSVFVDNFNKSRKKKYKLNF